MITLVSLAKSSGLLGRARSLGGAVAVAAGLAVLATGCGTTHAPGAASGTSSAPAASAASSSAGSSSPGSSSPSGSTAAAPVPTVSGGAAGEADCAGWPAGAASTRLPAMFVPVAAEQCVTGIQDVPGKGTWETATLERATTNLGPLVNALREPGQLRSPGTFCSDVMMIPPQLVLISGSGQKVEPKLPVTGCGNVRAGVLSALSALSWQPLSVRLISQVSPDTMAPQMKPGGSPKSIQTEAGGSS